MTKGLVSMEGMEKCGGMNLNGGNQRALSEAFGGPSTEPDPLTNKNYASCLSYIPHGYPQKWMSVKRSGTITI